MKKSNETIPLNEMKLKGLNAIPLSNRKYNLSGSKLNGWFLLTEQFVFWSKDSRIDLTKGSYVHLVDGVVHKDDGPAAVEKNILTHSVVYFAKNGELDNNGNPSHVIYNKQVIWDGANFIADKDSCPIEWTIHKNGIMHCVEGPAHYSCLHFQEAKTHYINGSILSYSEFKTHYEVKKLAVKKQMHSLMKENL